ncbi:MAG: phBC6A51 family helix-turn-helix protein [Candidatus Pacebacteria bacterium]|nr:phBC6A51 family helix-turn-helix protein [Candidatus Paceibacterota bacterium]
MSKAIEKRQQKEKQLLLEQLRKTPIIQIACEKAGIGRATYYRWRNEDKEFAQEADKALTEGSLLINDMAESQLLSSIKDKNMTAIIFWLKHHHKAYTDRLEISTVKQEEPLTTEQEKLIQKALTILNENNEPVNS